MQSRAPDFGARAARYDELRPVDDNWWELFQALLTAGDLSGRRVLEVGCGTGALAVALAERARVWAVDSSPEMLEVARGREGGDRVGWRVADATALPFRAGWFDRVVMRLVAHLVDRPRAFGEALRVVVDNGRVAIATFDPEHFDRYWLNELFPSLERIHNGHPVAYFDGPGGTQVPRGVVDRMTDYLYRHNANTHARPARAATIARSSQIKPNPDVQRAGITIQ